MDNKITIIVNGSKEECNKDATVKDIINTLGVADKSIVAEVDGQVLSKNEFDTFKLYENAKVELIRFVGGG